MSQPQAHQQLNRLVAILNRSFPQYLRWARPWTGSGGKHAIETLERIAYDQDRLKERIVDALLADDISPDMGEFPMEYTDTHDLAVDYLVRMAINYQRQDIATIEECVDALRLAPAALLLGEETLGLFKGHLRLLEELAAAAPATSSSSTPSSAPE